MTIYIAGKMRGIPNYNFPAFDALQAQLEKDGHRVISPANLDRAYGYDYTGKAADSVSAVGGTHPAFDMKMAVRRDVEALLNCDALALLPGWTESLGATAEVSIAKWIGIEIYYPGDTVPAEKEAASV